MRPKFFEELHKLMKENPDVWLLVGDLGYGGADKIRQDFPHRFINTGAAEFSMVGIAAGLALSGKIPFCYTITPFYYRAFEMIRTYIDHEEIPVILVGSGRDQEYEHDGYSHNASDVRDIFTHLSKIKQYFPLAKAEIPTILELVVKKKQPAFLSLSKKL